MTPNQITSLIASGLDRQLDFPFRLQLMDRVKVWRSRLIANALSKAPDDRKFFTQTVFVDLKNAPNIPNAELISETISVSKEELPTLVRAGGVLFDYLGSADGRHPYRHVTAGTGVYMDMGKFSNLFPAFAFINNRIALDRADQPLVRVDSIFDDPITADVFSCKAADVVCDTWNKPYPITGEMLQLVIQSIMQVDYNRVPPKPEDEVKP